MQIIQCKLPYWWNFSEALHSSCQRHKSTVRNLVSLWQGSPCEKGKNIWMFLWVLVGFFPNWARQTIRGPWRLWTCAVHCFSVKPCTSSSCRAILSGWWREALDNFRSHCDFSYWQFDIVNQQTQGSPKMKWLCNCVGEKGMRWFSPPAIGLSADTATTSIYPRHHSNAMMSYINKGRTPAKKCFLSGIARITSDLNWDLTYRGNLSLVRMWGKPLFKNPDSNEHCPFWRRLLVMICGTFLSLKRWFDKISQIS